MIDQGLGGDLVYIVSKNAFFAGPNNVAYGAAKADQAHQVRLLAAELGEYGIRVNGVNPDGVVRGSGIFAKGWGADRARTYGIPEDKLGEFYAQRTILKKEVLPGARRGGGVRARRAATCRRPPGSTSRSTPGSPPRSCGDRRGARLTMRVALFITCFNDLLFPEVGRATVRILEALGHEVAFPETRPAAASSTSTAATATSACRWSGASRTCSPGSTPS